MAVCRTTRDGRGFTEPLCPDLKDFLSSSFLGAPHAICGSQTTGYDVFNFKRQPVFSSEVGCLVTPIGEGDLPRAIVEVKLVGTGGSGDFHPADFCMGTACIQGTCPSLFPDHLNSFIPLSFSTLKCVGWDQENGGGARHIFSRNPAVPGCLQTPSYCMD